MFINTSKINDFIKYTHYSMIVARDSKGIIGFNNELPWPKSKSDMAWFRKHTLGKVIVMGRKTFESLGSKPLPGRTNIVVSTTLDKEIAKKWNMENQDQESGYLLIAPNVKAVKELISNTTGSLHNGGEVMIIGGAEIYQAFWADISRLYLTTFKGSYPGDVEINIDLSGFDLVYRDATQFGEPVFEIYDPRASLEIKRYPSPPTGEDNV